MDPVPVWDSFMGGLLATVEAVMIRRAEAGRCMQDADVALKAQRKCDGACWTDCCPLPSDWRWSCVISGLRPRTKRNHLPKANSKRSESLGIPLDLEG